MQKIQKARLFDPRSIVLMGVLIAVEVVLSRFLSYSVWNMKIGFAFIPVTVAAMTLGPLRAGIVAALADFIGAVLFPIGPYFPGYTLSAFLTGVADGVFLYRGRGFLRVLAAVAVKQLAISLLLTSFWISFTSGAPYIAQVEFRLLQCAVMIPVQLAVIPLLRRTVIPQIEKSRR